MQCIYGFSEEIQTKPVVSEQQHKVEILPPKKADAFRTHIIIDDPASPYAYQKQVSVPVTSVEYQPQVRHVMTDGQFSAHGSPALDAEYQRATADAADFQHQRTMDTTDFAHQRVPNDTDFQNQRVVTDYSQKVGVSEFVHQRVDTEYVYHSVPTETDYTGTQTRTDGVDGQYEDTRAGVEVATDYSSRRLVAEDYSILRTGQVGDGFSQPRATAVLESDFQQQRHAAIQRELAQQQRVAVEEFHRHRAAAAAMIIESELHNQHSETDLHNQRTALEAEYPNQRLAALENELQHQRAVSQIEAELHHQRALAETALQRASGVEDFSHQRSTPALDFTTQRTLEEEFQQRATPGGSIDFSQQVTLPSRDGTLTPQHIDTQAATYQQGSDAGIVTTEYHQRLTNMEVAYDTHVVDGRALTGQQAYNGQEEVVTTDMHGNRQGMPLPTVPADPGLQIVHHHQLSTQTMTTDPNNKDATVVMRDDEEKSIAAILLG